MEYKKARSFTDLVVWQRGHELVLEIYKITENFPQKEMYALTSQMRRAAVSVTSNIAEGFSRNSTKEKINFYYIAIGSLEELRNQLFIARDIRYVTQETVDKAFELITLVSRLANGLIKSIK